MTLTLSGQKPAVLTPVHTLPISGGYDPIPAIRKTIVKPLFKPVRKGGQVAITNPKNVTLDKDDVLGILLGAVGPTVDPDSEDAMKALLQQGLVHYDKSTPLLVNEMFAVQAGHANKLPNPGPNVMYTAAHDVIPEAKNLLGGHTPDDSAFFASLAYTYSPEALGFWFQTEADFDDFKVWLDQQTQALSSILPGATTAMLKSFGQTTLSGLVEGYLLRKTDSDGNDEYSFARVIVHLLMKYQQHLAQQNSTNVAGVLPFVVSELYLPRTIILVNVEAHARATARKVENEWKLVNASIAQPIKVISNSALSKLTALPRAMAKASAMAATAQSNKNAQTGRSAKIVFKKLAPTKVDIERDLLRVMGAMKEVSKSSNVTKRVRTSYAKANRRDPMDFNRPGKITTTHYLPDLHAFVDTSGSISEANYQQAVMMLIRLAKKLNVDLYFNSFSHVMSQEVLLKTKDKTEAQIWEAFRKVPKVSGGTEYRQIWDYINQSEKRKRRLSLAVTDFEWGAPSQRVEHPRNLHYAPCSSMDWDQLLRSARSFSRSMRHIEPAIGQRFIGMVV